MIAPWKIVGQKCQFRSSNASFLQCKVVPMQKNNPRDLSAIVILFKIQGDPFKLSQTSGVAPCKIRL